jgi:hypothetical protein
MLQITGTGTLTADQEQIECLREQFMAQQLLKLPAFLEASVLKRILSHLETATFAPDLYLSNKTDLRIGKEMAIDVTNAAASILTMLLNSSRLLRIMEQITNVSPLRCFMGRIYRCLPDSDHHILWHDDNVNNRLLGISVNLSKEPFAGGVLQLREKGTQRILAEAANTGLGDAVIFPISSDIEHRTTLLEGKVARTSGAGWFHSQPAFPTLIQNCRKEHVEP